MKSLLFKSLALAVASLSLAACELDGSLKAHQNLQLVDKKGKVIQLLANVPYHSSIEKKDGKLEIDIKIDGKERKVVIRPPTGQSVPTSYGELFVTAAQSGQPVDMRGILNTEYDRGPDQRGTESCTEQERITVCKEVLKTKPDGSTYKDEVCLDETRTHYGTQDIEYYTSTTTTTGDIHMLIPGQNIEVARFHGVTYDSDRIITQRGYCRTRGGHGGGHGRGWGKR